MARQTGLEAGTDEVAQLEDGRIGDEPVGIVPLGPAPHETGLLQHAKLLADVRLGRRETRGQLGDIAPAADEELKKPKAQGIRQNAEPLRDKLEGLGRQVVHSTPNHITY